MYRSTHYRRVSWLSYFVVGVAGILAGTTAFAQEVVHPCNRRDFRIPFSIDNNGQGLSALYLYVSNDHGQNYKYVHPPASPATPAESRFFVYHAPADGEYWFVVQTRDTRGGLQPTNPALAPPNLKVLVDTQPPRILQFRSAPPQDGSRAAVEWTIDDDNFDRVSLEYRAQGTPNEQWFPVPNPVQTARTVQGFTPVIEGPLEVRLRVQDKAGNVAEQMTTLVQIPGRQVAAAPGQAPPAENGPGNIMHVNSKTFMLNYSLDEASLGPSGIKNVEIFSTHDGGRTWQQSPQPAPKQGPCKFTVATSGRWGFTLVPVSGVGMMPETPKAGDVPQLWVEVDESRPTVTLLGLPIVGRGSDAGFLTINWRASDSHLRRDGITLSFRVKPDDPWTPIPGAERLAGTTTSYRVSTQGLPYQFYVQVKAIDEAGNEGEAATEEPVKVDLTVPRIKHLVVQPAASGMSGGAAPFSPPEH